MIQLDLLGVGADGHTLVFTDSQGERYTVAITDELRGCVRRDRPVLEAIATPGTPQLRPKDIQALLRAGASPEDIARDHGLEVQQVLRYEGPVKAEQDYALSRALGTHIGDDEDAPIVGDLVVDRLAARGVDASTLAWSARREGSGPWEICLTFVQGAAEIGAHWTLSSSGQLDAIDQEAKWLTETVSLTPTSSIFTPLPPNVIGDASADDLSRREALIDDLNAARGKRQPVEIDCDDDDDYEAFLAEQSPSTPPSSGTHTTSGGIASAISARILSLAHTTSPTAPTGTENAATTVDEGTTSNDAEAVLPGLDTLTPAPDRTKRKSGRRSVPSWDEIVFGSKP
ncbi:septation protein SepH [Schaalia suimastitidis]|uniref:septation protein SepH n=1 Tax=Schaalia suimastitidis TaxID=121163 RepID=UPI000416EB1E|nr:septation protein SepH [Schaalia suimastitidis]